MGQHCALVSEVGRVGHESHFATQALGEKHGEQGLHVAFATRHNAFIIEQSQGESTRRAAGFHNVEAADGKGIQTLFRTDSLDGQIDLGTFKHVGT